jgi:hypothetical protein
LDEGRKSMTKSKSVLQTLMDALTLNLGTKLVSIFVAMILWGVVLGSRNVEVTKEVPVEFVTSADVVPGNELPDRISFRLSGPKAFLRTILDRREDPIRINLNGVKPSVLSYRVFSDSIRVPIGVKVLSVSPAEIPIKLEYLRRKDVPVRIELRGVPPEGFRVGKVEVRPEIVRVKGPESRVDAVTEVVTKPIEVSDLKKTFDKEVALDLARAGVQLDGPLPRGLVEIEPISANFRIKNVDIRVISSYKVRVEEQSVTVLVRATPKEMEALDRNQVFAVVDLRTKGMGRFYEPVRVTLPPSVGLVKAIPDHVTVTLY